MDADLYEANKIIDEQIDTIKDLERKIEIKDKYLELMWFLGVDYDGYDTAEGLKSLIDELMDLCKKAGKNDDKWAAYEGGDDKFYNILYEEVEKPEEDE